MTKPEDPNFDVITHQMKCMSLRDLLVEKHPSGVNLCISYFESHPPPWYESDTNEPNMKKKKKSKHSPELDVQHLVQDEDILRFVLVCLETSPVYFRNQWKWSTFVEKYFNVESKQAKWLMIKCLALVNQLNEKDVHEMMESMDLSAIQCCLDHHFRTEEFTQPYVSTDDLHSSILKSVSVAGIEVQCVQYESSPHESRKPTNSENDQLVLVGSAKSNLQSLALAVASQKPVCLIGPVGCGKTALAHHLAEITGRKRKPHFLTVQLGEELDAKMLLGSYKCTDILGEFIWQPGILTQAMMNGYWLLLEDIDSVSSDVAALFQSLIQNNSLNVPGFKDNLVPAHGFQLLFTQRILSGATGVSFQKRTPATDLLSQLWRQVSMEPMTSEELIHIIQTKFPILSTVASRMVKVFLLFSSGLHENTEEMSEHLADIGRLVSTRDLMKWCVRVEQDFQVTSQESGLVVCQEALDIFLGHVAKPDIRQNLGRRVAATLGIVHMKADYFLSLHRPTIQLQDKHCVVGRVSLDRVSTGDLPFRVSNVKDNFALTRIASCLIEKVAVCLSRSEPVLLVGETATGKTSTLQLLAQHTNNHLVVINMNQQSDSTDLLGGFKPIDFKLKMKPLRDSFEALFRRTFPMQKNKSFMTKLSEYFSQSNWKVLLTLMINVAESAQQKLLADSNSNITTDTNDSNANEKIDSNSNITADTNDANANEKTDSKVDSQSFADSNNKTSDSLNRTPSNAKKRSKSKKKQSKGAADSNERVESVKSAQKSVKSAEKSELLEKNKSSDDARLVADWKALLRRLKKLQVSSKKKGESQHAMAFSFIEGTLVKALREGHWILLDEINLASAETLQCLSGLLERCGSVCLYERGDIEPVPRHCNFRLLAAMNPATDVGKKDLPAGLRNRFTELFVDELLDPTDLNLLISCYLPNISLEKRQDITKFYLKVKQEPSLADGTGHRPHFSLRTLCRALSVAATNPCHSMLRSLYEAFCLSFITQLDAPSMETVNKLIASIIVGPENAKQIISEELPEKKNHVRFEGYWIARGAEEPQVSTKYILTPQVQSNLQNLSRAVALSSHPVLIQGDTSVGKTSLVTYLAQSSGHKCFRINNHEHTDFQEYVGAYCAHPETGHLLFQEGVLAKAMRLGYWIILDELNLAPCEVLEALNRVLDDNRELYIPETQETIRAHPDFRVFATQNPPGLYGGRKILSRAFRNRFVELHFNEIPSLELETILHKRCEMPPSYAKKVVAVMGDLQKQRRGSAAFAGKQGFMTLRDLFRWGERYRLASHVHNPNHYDWDQHIADEGYLVLAGRVRKLEEKQIIISTLEKWIKRKVDVERLFSLTENTSPVTRHILEKVTTTVTDKFHSIVWTQNMRQLAVLIGKAVEFQEPALLVGETGCGKTTMCQLLASQRGQGLYMINCHQHTESSDFLGGLRPVRNRSQEVVESHKLFEWVDGPLIHAMKTGGIFLADEISLADDSVLERLNSLLEPERKLVISEKGDEIAEELTAHERFHFIGTMNPGGDFGKKELSPALRNRLTEIWCEPCTQDGDLVMIVDHNLDYEQFGFSREKISLGKLMLEFRNYYLASDFGKRATFSIRDYLTWVNFINVTVQGGMGVGHAYVHGAFVTFLDILGTGATSSMIDESLLFRRKCSKFLRNQMIHVKLAHKAEFRKTMNYTDITCDEEKFGTWDFYIENKKTDSRGSVKSTELFSFSTPTTHSNLVKILRAMQLPHKAILLEGSPGVGKTALLKALAEVTGHELTRINLSEQTDVCDLFGTDLPVDGGDGGQFEWKDGPFLKALKDEHWILLDELNLASQSVLEGLNAVLDHRGELYIPEIGRSFLVKPGTRLFATQNPLSQGSSRKGLPKSFLNRFTQVYISTFSTTDTKLILKHVFKDLVTSSRTFSKMLDKMLLFSEKLNKQCGVDFAFYGAPWEINLRDLTRWVEAMQGFESSNPGDFVGVIYADRMRTSADKQRVEDIYKDVFPEKQFAMKKGPFTLYATPGEIYFGDIRVEKQSSGVNLEPDVSQNLVLRQNYNALRSLAVTCSMQWMTILVGGESSKQVISSFAQLSGRKLHILSVSSEMDTMEILGGYEQMDVNRHLSEIAAHVEVLLSQVLSLNGVNRVEWMRLLEKFNEESQRVIPLDEQKDTKVFLDKCDRLKSLLRPVGQVESASAQELNEALLNRLDSLKARVKHLSQSGKIASGGFEWVDSILVKCLRQGSWLLMDNVNMCSAAVLDRLNGLLEPKGVLTLHERGVTPEGDLYTIVPHADFRLFLCMDPKYGEISRAMRNRGVEIALVENPLDLTSLEHQEEKTVQEQSKNSTDIETPAQESDSIGRTSSLQKQKSLENDVSRTLVATNIDIREQLTSLGVEDFQTQCFLVEVHLAMSAQCAVTYETSHLLRAAHLFSQYRQQKFERSEAMRIACREVYVKTMLWCPGQYDTLVNLLSEILEGYSTDSNEKQDICPVLPIRTRDYLYDSTFSRLRHQTWLLYCYIRHFAQQFSPVVPIANVLPIDSGPYSSVAGIPVVEINFLEAFRHLVLIAYDYASLGDLEFRRAYILRLVQQIRTARSKMKSIVSSDHTTKGIDKVNESFESFSKKKKKRKSLAQKSSIESCDTPPSPPCDSTISDSTLSDNVSISDIDTLVDTMTVIVNIAHNVSESQCEIMFANETHRPFDVRRTMLKANTNGGVNNKCILLKIHYINKYMNEHVNGKLPAAKTKSFTVMKYSELFKKDELPFSLNSSVLSHFNEILTRMDTVIQSILLTPSTKFTSQDLVPVYLFLMVKHRFESLGQHNIGPDQCPNHIEQVLSELHLHFQWFNKLFDKFMHKFFWDDGTYQTLLHRSKLAQYNKFSRRLLRDYTRPYQKLLVACRKKFSTVLPIPLPPACASVAKLNAACQTAWETLSVWNHGLTDEEVASRIVLLMTDEAKSLRQELTVALSLLNSNTSVCETTVLDITTRIETIQTQLAQIKASTALARDNALARNRTDDFSVFTAAESNTESCNTDQEPVVAFSAQIKLVPFYEYLASKLIPSVVAWVYTVGIQRRLMNGSDELRALSSLLAEVPSMPPHILVNLQSQPDLMHLLIALSELGFYRHVAPWLYTEELVRTSEEAMEVDVQQDDRNKDLLLSAELPLLSHLLVQVLHKPHSHILSASTLGSHAQRSALLSQIKSLLWRNLPAIARANRSSSAVQVTGLSAEFESLSRLIIGGDKLRHLKCARDLLHHSGPDGAAQATGELQVLLGHLQLLILSKLELIDPVEKNKLKLQHLRHVMSTIRAMLSLEAQHSTLTGDDHRTPHGQVFLGMLRYLVEKEVKCVERVGVRPEQNALLYSNLLKEVNNFMRTVASQAKVFGIIQGRKLCLLLQKQQAAGYCKQEMMTTTADVKAELIQWRFTVMSFMAKLRADYAPWYPDVVTPLVYATTQILTGVTSIIVELQRNLILAQLDTSSAAISPLLGLMVRFPYLDKKQCLDFISTVNSPGFLQRYGRCFSEEGERADALMRLVKCSLEELQNIISIQGGSLHGRTWDTMRCILAQLVASWHTHADKAAREQQEEESLYLHKTRTHCTPEQEDEEIDRYVKEMFPTNRAEFAEFEDPVSLEDSTTRHNIVKSLEKSISTDSMLDTCLLHSSIVKTFTSTHWLGGHSDPSKLGYFDPVKPFIERFSVYSVLLGSYLGGLEADVDNEALPSLVLMSEVALQYKTHQRHKEYDFYRDPNVEQVSTCLPILHTLDANVTNLLAEWPDHPTLQTVSKLIERILSFDITSPVSRFLTGLEILLAKVHEWEQVAHSGVSLAIHSESLTSQIIDWRKFELSLWKNCLGITTRRVSQATSKYWFHLYAVCESFVKDESMGGDQVRKVLANFIENCSLGVFHSRLELLLTFHCHMLEAAQDNQRARDLSNILWNMYKYFSQFTSSVNGKVQEMSAPIQKQVKDFVKIARWNDINYYAVKQTTEKTHRTLAKHVKEFERVLNGHVAAGMTDLDEGKKVTSTKVYGLVESVFTSNLQLELLLQVESVEPKLYPMVVSKLHPRSSKLCKSIMNGNNYNVLIGAVNEFVTNILENLEHARSMSVDTNQIKEKQQTQAKQFLQFKRKCLVDLFSLLTRSGLSYRYGTVSTNCKLREISSKYFSTPPLNVKIAMDKLARRDSDLELIASWSGFDKHLLKSQARLSQLLPLLKKPHKQVSPQTVPRLKGFASHLMHLNVEQYSHLVQCLHLFYSLRYCLTLLPEISTKTKLLKPFKASANELLSDLIYYFKQLDVFITACPEKKSDKGLIAGKCSTIISACKHDGRYNEIKEKVDGILKRLSELTARLNKVETTSDFLEQLLASMHMDSSYCSLLVSNELCFALDEVFTVLHSLLNDIQFIKKQFDVIPKLLPSHLNYKEPYVQYSLTNSLWQVEQKILNSCEKFFNLNLSTTMFHEPKLVELDASTLGNSFFKDLEKKVDEFLHKIMIPIQGLYKKYMDNNENVDVSNIAEKSVHELISKNHLKEKLFEDLAKDVNALNMKTVLNELLAMLSTCMSSPGFLLLSCVRTIQQVIPLLDQYCLLCGYFITHEAASLRASAKLCSILCATFGDLAKRGFCIADELITDDNDGEGQDMKGGMGLGDDEGQNDVSDQIESQDQMEDCKPEGSKEKDEDKDCKEEEKGVEMSDDFSGKLQDIEDKPEEGDDKEEDDKEKEQEEDPDNEMGETDANAEKLDEEVWGSDSEEEPEDEQDKTEDDADKGKQTGEKELGAKDNSKNETEGEDKEEFKDDKKKEINEMDDQGEEDQDQVDPLHGNQEPLPEPEAFDLPDNLNLDGEEQDENEEGNQDENPLEIDQMKEPDTTEDVEEEGKEETKQNEQEQGDSSEDEDDKQDEENGEKGDDIEKEEVGENEEETEGDEDGGKKDENKTGEERKEEEKKEREEEEASASEDRPTLAQAEAADNKDQGSKDDVKEPSDSKESKPLDPQDNNTEEATGPEQKGVGMTDKTEAKKSKGHEGDKDQSRQAKEEDKENNEKKRQKPGESNEERTLGDVDEPVKKRLKTKNSDKENRQDHEEEEEEGDEDMKADLYEHIKESKDKEKPRREQTLDAATNDQAEKQTVQEDEVDEKEDENNEGGEDVPSDDDEPMEDPDDIPTQKSEKLDNKTKKNKNKRDETSNEPDEAMESGQPIEIEGEVIQTQNVERGADTTFHTQANEYQALDYSSHALMDPTELRLALQKQLASWSQPPPNAEASRAWDMFSLAVTPLAQQLSQELRLVLEPTRASSLRGDFRTGRRINMRKVIPYIASKFRKDKIWLRRTKPQKRDYQIVLAIDDSSSMADNQSKELAFESLALVSKALTLLETGELSIVSFGETTKVLHHLGDQFSEFSGASILQQFKFDQTKTRVANLVEEVCKLFVARGSNSSSSVAQLLVIISDGRNINNEGANTVKSAVKMAKSHNVFIVFLIIDNPQSKNSILDIRMPVFNAKSKVVALNSYLDSFPFPFYLILRDINSLPSVLSDALRQWFELVTSHR